MKSTPFFGPAYVSRSTNLADQRLINLYPEVVEDKGSGKEVGGFYSTPGLRLFETLGAGPIRGLHVLGETKLFAASGADLYLFDTVAGTITNLGSMGPSSSGFASMIDNGTQLFVASGAVGSVYANGSMTTVTLPFSAQPISAASQDGYGVINQAGTYVWWQSNLLDLTTWDALNFASADTNPDNVVAIAQCRREMYLIKERGTEIWYNVGTPGFVFARNQGLFIEHGTVAPASVAKSGESLLWLSRSNEGHGVVIEVTGYQAKRVSTSGLENQFLQYPILTDAIGYCYQQDGHHFYVLTFPAGDQTWVYDRTTSNILGIPMWHQRASIDDSGVLHRHWGNCQVFFQGENIVGDYRNGNLYILDLDEAMDWQSPRMALRSWRALDKPSENPVRFPPLRIDMQTGALKSDAARPLAGLKWSDDGGHTWSNGMLAQAGNMGQTAKRVMFRRLGQTRRDTGLDRIFELTLSNDSLPCALIGAQFGDET